MARIAPAFAGVPTCCMQVGRYSIGGKRVVAAPGCWMVLLIITLGLAADASFGGDASAAASDPVQERGLQHAQTGLELVEKAVASTNLVARGTGMRLVMSAQGGKLNSRTSQDSEFEIACKKYDTNTEEIYDLLTRIDSFFNRIYVT